MGNMIQYRKIQQTAPERKDFMNRQIAFPKVFSSVFQEHMQNNIWNFQYFDRNIKSLLQQGNFRQTCAIAYVDSGGVLLNLYGAPAFLKELKEKGIIPGTLWTRQTTGKSAVTAGLSGTRPAQSIGEENSLAVLKNYAIYYQPILFKPASPGFLKGHIPKNFGGLFLLVPAAAAGPGFMFLLSALTHDTVMTLHFNQSALTLHEQSGRGVLAVDSQMVPGQNTITYANQTLFDRLSVPCRDVLFHSLEELFPAAENKELLHLVEQGKSQKDKPAVLKIDGKTIYALITCIPFEQPVIHARGMIFLITTQQWETGQIAGKMGNSAVLAFPNIIGNSPRMQSAFRRAKLVANAEGNIMILGESGVGKDLFAQAIHNASSRKNKPFIVVNCGALPRDLITSELFGYDPGAFTGAKKNGNIGKFELANGGTIFLDEIGELPMDLQANLLRLVEQKQLMRLGSSKLMQIDVRIICATNANLQEMIRQKRFRMDLYFRLSTFTLSIPPLREREGDILLLSRHFIHRACAKIGRPDMKLSPEAEKLLTDYPWPGNVRELQNVMECIAQLYPDDLISPEHIRENLLPSGRFSSWTAESPAAGEDSPHRKRRRFTKEEITEALKACGGNRSETARKLGIGRKTLYRKLEEFGMLK